MRSPGTLQGWTRHLLPTQGRCARWAGAQLVRALLVNFTTNLCQLGRQTDAPRTAKSGRQNLERWLEASHWDPEGLYGGLNRFTRRVLRAGGQDQPLLMDVTFLGGVWAVLQISIPWQQRALPLYRVVRRWEDPAGEQPTLAEMVEQALAWLAKHLPGPRARYVLVADRGFPSHAGLRALQAAGWRFVLRVKSTWKLSHPEHTGALRDLPPPPGGEAGLYRDGVLGSREKGAGKRIRHSQAHVVAFHGAGYQAPWYLVTSEANACLAVRLYWERMRIEQEFRDLKGPGGLDELAKWESLDRVRRFLAWVAVYEWRLAYLWLAYDLESFAPLLQVKGRLSWIRVTREWVARQWRCLGRRAPACL